MAQARNLLTKYFRPLNAAHRQSIPAVGSGLATIYDLPPELVDIIASQLEWKAFCALRLTCKHIAETSFYTLARRIQGLRFLNAPHALTALLDMANDPRLGNNISTLRLGTAHLVQGWADEFYDDRATDAAMREDQDELAAIQTCRENFKRYAERQHEWIKGDDISMLMAIMASLPNLQNVEVGEWDNSLVGDLERLSFCYGMRNIVADCWRPEYHSNFPFYMEDLFMNDRDDLDWEDLGITYHSSLARNTQAVLRALSVIRKPIRSLSAHQSLMPSIPMNKMTALDSYYKDGLRAAFRQLKELKLGVSWNDPPGPPHTQYNNWLLDLVNLAPQLEHLFIGQDAPYGSECPSIGGFNAFVRMANIPR